MKGRLDGGAEDRFWTGVRASERFFSGESEVQQALEKLARLLDEDGIPYAIVGAMALNAFGYRRTTVDVDVLLTADGLAAFKQRHLGRGYAERFPGSRSLRDTEHQVDVDVILAGSFPGDGQPKPVVFPDPAAAAERGAHIALLPLPTLLELKLASGISASDRLKDLADVQEVIRILQLPRSLGDSLDLYVRDKYLQLWDAVHHR
ncbi:MAG TPA: hypothetical protein VEU08_15285 [Vicinamibacterales bacterium]|nr:hypothetical protein [Vicinamibacterales bacterium]